jgi:hypothetical protein
MKRPLEALLTPGDGIDSRPYLIAMHKPLTRLMS